MLFSQVFCPSVEKCIKIKFSTAVSAMGTRTYGSLSEEMLCVFLQK